MSSVQLWHEPHAHVSQFVTMTAFSYSMVCFRCDRDVDYRFPVLAYDTKPKMQTDMVNL